MLSNTDLHRLIVDLRKHPLAKGGLRQVKEGVYVSLKQSQPKGFDYAFCLSDTDECTFSSGRPIGLLLQPVPSKARLLAFEPVRNVCQFSENGGRETRQSIVGRR